MEELARRTGLQARTLANLLRNPIFKGWRVIDKQRGREKYASRNGRQADRKKVPRDKVIKIQVIAPGAVAEERWQRVQDLLDDRALKWRREREAAGSDVNLGTGIAVCGHCGARLYASSGRRKDGRKMAYYFCARNHYKAKRPGESCPQPNIQKPHLHLVLSAFLTEYLREETTIRALAKTLEPTEPTLPPGPSVEKALAAIDEKQSRFLTIYLDGAITPEVFRARKAKLDVEAERYRNLEEHAKKAKARSKDGAVALQQLVEGCFALGRLGTDKERHQACKALFREIAFQGPAITAFRPQLANHPAGVCITRIHPGRVSVPTPG